jgi:homoserine kinase type II
MAVYTLLTDDDKTTIAEAYGFERILATHPIAEGVENTNYLLEYQEDDGETYRAILTIFEQRVNAAELPFFLELKRHLRGKGIVCPEPYRTQTGELLFHINGKAAAVVSFLEGKSVLHPHASHIMQAGETLAKLHLAAADFPLQRQNTMSFAGWEMIRTRIAARAVSSEHSSLLRAIDAELDYARAHWVHTLPQGVIHADFFPNNVFFDEAGTLSGVIDFYFACNDALAYDAAIVANAWCFEAGVFQSKHYAALMAAYDVVRPFTAAERDAMPMLLRVAALRFLLTRLHDVLYHDAAALVTPHDPMEYFHILTFHQRNT